MLTKDIIREILNNIGFRYAEIERNSYYLLSRNRNRKPIQIRISNHGTFLATWVGMANGKDSKIRLVDPSMSINISIVFIDKDNDLTKVCPGQSDCENCGESICKPSIVKGITSKNRQYTVLQYIYRSDMINNKYLKSIINAIKRASIGGKYIDPLRNLQIKKAKVKSMETHDNLTENNNTKTQYKMKQRIRLTEGDLHRIIRKCVKEALEKPFRTAETVGPFVNNRAQFLNLRTKKEQMDSDWADLRNSGAYPYGDCPNNTNDGWIPNGDYIQSEEDRENGDYPSNPNVLNRRFWESRQRKRNEGLTEAKLHKIIKRVLKEDSGNYEYMEHYYVELFHRDGDIVDCEEFGIDDLKSAIKWAKAQAAAHPDLVSEVFYVDEHGDSEETGYYYGDWSV